MVRSLILLSVSGLFLVACAQGNTSRPEVNNNTPNTNQNNNSSTPDASVPTDSGPGSDAQTPPDAGGACVCASGVCCDGCYYKWIDVQCDAVPVETEYRCTGSGCGADLERRQSFRHCDGLSSGCGTTNIVWGDYELQEDCATDALCEYDTTSGQCSTCAHGCDQGACIQPDCTTGACCDNGSYASSATVCGTSAYDTEYQCNGSSCGANAESREQWQYCDGSSAICGTGNLVWNGWQVIDDCTSSELCESDGSSASCVSCPNGCSGGSCVCGQGSNIAGSGTASLSSGSTNQTLYGPHKAIDNIGESGCSWTWITADNAPGTAWLQIDWPTSRTIWGFHIDTVSTSSAPCTYTSGRTLTGATIQYWNGSWVTAGTVSGKTNDWDYTFSTPVTTTKLRLYGIYSQPSDNPVVFEWQVWECS